MEGFLPAASSSEDGTIASPSVDSTYSLFESSFIGTLTSTGFPLASRVPIKVKSTLEPTISGIRTRMSRTVCPRSLECIPLKATV